MKLIKTYCNHDSCTQNGTCDNCQASIIVDRTFTDEIKVILPSGYKQRFWVDINDYEAIKRCLKMQEQNIKSA